MFLIAWRRVFARSAQRRDARDMAADGRATGGIDRDLTFEVMAGDQTHRRAAKAPALFRGRSDRPATGAGGGGDSRSSARTVFCLRKLAGPSIEGCWPKPSLEDLVLPVSSDAMFEGPVKSARGGLDSAAMCYSVTPKTCLL